MEDLRKITADFKKKISETKFRQANEKPSLKNKETSPLTIEN
jgi:hypothetical protein